MCVAIYKPKGIKAPTIETLKDCWDANPDGAGMAWRTDGKFPIHIEKGFMTWKAFNDYWHSANIDKYDGDLFIHFRITTHGGTSDGNTHPFPISNSDKVLKSLSLSSHYALMHNGVLPITPDNKLISDTMMLSKLIARGEFENKIQHTLNLLEGLIGTNKIAVMTANNVHLVGAWQDVDGVKFSNLHWQYKFTKSSCCGFGTCYGSSSCESGKWYDKYKSSYIRTDDVTDVVEDADDTANLYNDYYVSKPSDEELAMLNMGVCPYCSCDEGVSALDTGYVCDYCGSLWDVNYDENEVCDD